MYKIIRLAAGTAVCLLAACLAAIGGAWPEGPTQQSALPLTAQQSGAAVLLPSAALADKAEKTEKLSRRQAKPRVRAGENQTAFARKNRPGKTERRLIRKRNTKLFVRRFKTIK